MSTSRLATPILLVAAVLVAAAASAGRPRHHYDAFEYGGRTPQFFLSRCMVDADGIWRCTGISAYYEVDDVDASLDYYELFINQSRVGYPTDEPSRTKLWCRVDPASIRIGRDATNLVMDVAIDVAGCGENAAYSLDWSTGQWRYLGAAYAGVVTIRAELRDPAGGTSERVMWSQDEGSEGGAYRYQCQVYSGQNFRFARIELNATTLPSDGWQSWAQNSTCPRPPLSVK